MTADLGNSLPLPSLAPEPPPGRKNSLTTRIPLWSSCANGNVHGGEKTTCLTGCGTLVVAAFLFAISSTCTGLASSFAAFDQQLMTEIDTRERCYAG
jgi:hypothetical protein